MPAPDLQSSKSVLHADAALDCRATAALLKAMGPLVWASHASALLAASSHFWFPFLLWGLVFYFAIRIRLDAALLEVLACDPEFAPSRVDLWLSRAGLRAHGRERSIHDRCQGARRLACYLAAACILQIGSTGMFFLRSNL